jgi:localization factor PodJL
VPRQSSLVRISGALVLAACVLGGCVDRAPVEPVVVVEDVSDPDNPDEAYRAALRYRSGDGVTRDEHRATALLMRAAEGGQSDAQFLLAQAYADGEGVDPEPAWATMWYGRAAALGHITAQYRLALAHAQGIGTPVSFVEAYKWATIAAAAGNEEAGKLRTSLAGRMIREEIAPATRAAADWHPKEAGAWPDQPLIRFVQFSLRQLGYDGGPVDGVVGARTRGAIKAATQQGELRTDQITPALVDWLRARQNAMHRAGPAA